MSDYTNQDKEVIKKKHAPTRGWVWTIVLVLLLAVVVGVYIMLFNSGKKVFTDVTQNTASADATQYTEPETEPLAELTISDCLSVISEDSDLTNFLNSFTAYYGNAKLYSDDMTYSANRRDYYNYADTMSGDYDIICEITTRYQPIIDWTLYPVNVPDEYRTTGVYPVYSYDDGRFEMGASAYDGVSVEWVAQNIFHCDQAAIDAIEALGSEGDPYYPVYYENGKFYRESGAISASINTVITYAAAYNVDDYTFIAYDAYLEYGGGSFPEQTTRYYAVMKKIDAYAQDFWTLYTWSHDGFILPVGMENSQVQSVIDASVKEENENPVTSGTHFRIYDASEGLSLKAGPDDWYDRITVIPEGEIITVYSMDTTGWGYASYGAYVGYVYMRYTTPIDSYPATQPATELSEPEIHTITNDGEALDYRSAPGAQYPSYGRIPYGEEITVTAYQDGWAYTSYNGIYGWVYSGCISY